MKLTEMIHIHYAIYLPGISLKKLKIDNGNKIVIGHLYINSIGNKVQCLKYIIGFNVDILLSSETKLGDNFPTSQFQIDGYLKPYRKDCNDKGGGLLLYIREYIPSMIRV